MAKTIDPKRRHTREMVAYLAAKLMAEEGIQDFSKAKRKAARQLGVAEDKGLPGNAEIELALRQHQAIYQYDEQQCRIMALRKEAATIMKQLERFDPRITGPVLAGTATRYAHIDLMLFADSEKDVELFFLAHGIAYNRAEKRLRIGDIYLGVPVFTIEGETAQVEAVVLAPEKLRNPPRSPVDGKVVAWAGLRQLEQLMALGGGGSL